MTEGGLFILFFFQSAKKLKLLLQLGTWGAKLLPFTVHAQASPLLLKPILNMTVYLK
jgi:hypothetical protein